MKTKVDIVIPVLNEEATLDQNVRQVLDFAEKIISAKYVYRVIIADNGSTDKTPEIGRQLAQTWPNYVQYLQVGRRGVGLALKAAWQESTADLIGYMDLDLATDLKALLPALEALRLQDFDIVYGTRLHHDSKVVGRSLKRAVLSRSFNFLLKMYLGVHFSDGMCGFKFLKRTHLSQILRQGAVSDGWFFCTEILAVAERMNLKLFELPVTWTDDPTSKVKVVNLSLEYLRAMKVLKNRPYESREV